MQCVPLNPSRQCSLSASTDSPSVAPEKSSISFWRSQRAHSPSFEQLIECLWEDDPGVVNRASDAIERITRTHPALLQPWKAALLGLLSEAAQAKLRWNLALVVPRCKLSRSEAERAAAVLESWLEDKSSIVKACALQGLFELLPYNPAAQLELVELLRLNSRTGTPAVRARGRILLKKLTAGGAA